MTSEPRAPHPKLLAALDELFGIPAEDVCPEAELDADLHLDSLSVVELHVALEDELGVRIPADDPASVRTVADLQTLLEAALAAAAPIAPQLHLTDEG